MTKNSRFFSLFGLLFIPFLLTPLGNTAFSASTLKVTMPNNAYKWTTGKKYPIKWSKGNAGAYVKIQLTKSGNHYKCITKKTKNDGKYTWKIPSTVVTSSAYKIKITSTKNKKVFDSSNKTFTITKASGGDDSGGDTLKITAPNGGESWGLVSTNTIKWDKGTVGGYVILELRTGSGTSGSTELEITPQTKNDGSYSWKIPDTVATGTNYKIRIRSITDRDLTDTSNKTFSIVDSASLSLTSSAFTAGGKIPVKYTCDGNEASPPLTISGVSSSAKELVLFLDDLDGTPTATNTTTDWNHWVVTNIPVSGQFKDYRKPTGSIEGKNSEGDLKFRPICPPGSKGDRTKHNYRFTLYAIDKKLTNNSSTRAEIVTAMDGAILQKKTLTFFFESP